MRDLKTTLYEYQRRMFRPTDEERERDFAAARTIIYAPGSLLDPEVILARGEDPGFYRYVCVVPDMERRRRDEKRWKKMLQRGKRKPRKK